MRGAPTRLATPSVGSSGKYALYAFPSSIVLLRPGRAWLCTQGPDRVRRHASLIPTRATTASGGCGGSQELGTLCVAVAETICPVICHSGHTSSPHSSAAWSKPVTSWVETSRSNCAQLAVDTID